MFNKTMVGVLSFALICTASLSAQRLLVVADLPEILGKRVQETTKQRIKNVFGDAKTVFETEKNTPPFVTLLSMYERCRHDGERLRDAILKGLTEFMSKQGKNNMQKAFAEKASLQADGKILQPLITGNRHDVVLYVDLPQLASEFANTIYETVAKAFNVVYYDPQSTWRPYVTLGSFPRLLNPEGLEGHLKNINPQGQPCAFGINSVRILSEACDGTVYSQGAISLQENDCTWTITVTWEKVTTKYIVKFDGTKATLELKEGQPVKPAKARANKPAAKSADADEQADSDDKKPTNSKATKPISEKVRAAKARMKNNKIKARYGIKPLEVRKVTFARHGLLRTPPAPTAEQLTVKKNRKLAAFFRRKNNKVPKVIADSLKKSSKAKDIKTDIKSRLRLSSRKREQSIIQTLIRSFYV